MKKLPLILTLLFTNVLTVANGQQRIVDSLKQVLNTTRNDTLLLVLYKGLNEAYNEVNYDSALLYGRNYIQATQHLAYKLHEVDALLQLALTQALIGTSANALELLYNAQDILKSQANTSRLLPARYLQLLQIAPKLQSSSNYRLFLRGKLNTLFAYNYTFNDEGNKVRPYIFKALEVAQVLQAEDILSTSYLILGIINLDKPDSSLHYLNKGYQHDLQSGYFKNMGIFYNYMSKAYHEIGDHARDLHFKRATLHYHLQRGNLIFTGWSYLSMADYYRDTKASDSTLYYSHKALHIALEAHSPPMEYWSSVLLKDTYKALNKKDSAFMYMEQMVAAKEKISSEQLIRQYQAAEYNEQLQQKEAEASRLEYRNKLRMYGLLAGLITFILVAVLLWRNNLQRKKAYERLEQQKRETDHQKEKTEQALQELKATQAQLIQSEKMASLGELTAGIAHEIQNPLNFVNNFSETNTELLAEAQTELSTGNLQETSSLLLNIKENELKISHHGKRAEAIVNNMLQHSRSSKGERQETDLNALVAEYLRLAYHGFRAKDKAFNTIIETHYDETMGKVSIIQQDIGRVLLNLFNNAFYAVGEKKKQLVEGYEPRIWVSTKKLSDKIEIWVQDNGMGISKSLVDKIFQPFFTTKPTGEGTGLGLSLSYDIIKAHGGELQVESVEGEGSFFTIIIPTV